MTEMGAEVSAAIRALGLGSRVIRLPDEEARRIKADVIARFVAGGERTWWWEAFVPPTAAIEYPDGDGFEHVIGLVPNASVPCWFIVEDDDASCHPVYRASPEDAIRVVGECFAFEYYLVDCAMRWIVCENHHNVLIGAGERIVDAIQQAAG